MTLRSFIAKLKHLSIKTQFIISMFFILLCMLLLCLYMNRSIYSNYLSNTDLYTTNTIIEFENHIDTIVENINSICMQFQYNNTFYDLLTADSYHQLTSRDYEYMLEGITSSIMVNTYITDISLVNGLLHWSEIYQEDELMEIYRKMEGVEGLYCFGLLKSSIYNASFTPHLVFGYNLTYQAQPIGTIILTIDIPKAFFVTTKDTYYILHHPDHNIVTPINCDWSVSEPIIEKVQENSLYESSSATGMTDRQRFTITSSEYWIQTVFIPSLNCYMTGAVDLKELNEQMANTTLQLVIIVILCILFLALLWVIITRSFIDPFRTLSETIIHIREDKLRKISTPLEIDGCREIMDTSREFQDMLNSIHELNYQIITKSHDLYEAEIQRKIAELSYLKSQINPHFIYNTLELIRASATEHNVPEISDTALAIGKILRYSVKGDDFVTLRNELDITKSYLMIQQSRFNHKFEFIVNAPMEQENLYIMKMLLQPIVENAVFHGIEPKQDPSVILISATLHEDEINICVRDNGIGIPKEQLLSLRKALDSDFYDTSEHIGLVNTHARIRLQYGKPYGITIDSTLGDGTVVNLFMPVTYNTKT